APADAAQPPHMGMGMGMAQMEGALGSYVFTRESSGTSWQPDASPHEAIHLKEGDWLVMFHGQLTGVWDSQSGPRGGEKAFASGMLMAMAQRPLGDGELQLRAMLSPDPLMGPSGYPLLLATGETADGKTPLVDRQHPHDLFMELSASYAWKLAASSSAFVYAGLPGEPAFGPPAFMHRLSIMDSPEAPISHHWLDSTHITFGVITGGVVLGDWKVEASAYNGREPDQHRYDIETGPLDSTAVRLSWNPTRNWALQASWADEISPEQLEPGVDQHKVSASAIYTVDLGGHRWWSTTAAWGRRSSDGADLDAWVLESAVKPTAAWTIFSRAEHVQNDELTPALLDHGPIFNVGKVSLGAIRDFPVSEHLLFGVGGLYSLDFVPSGLKSAYGSSDPHGVMAFVRLKLR
ncbi:hypothetical protein, partial [Phenylobacterium sp.]|uniref:hypothetical protein n=1 Tax=Phenylobacterium sp. TaxID=1871053 RepID=UPI00260076D1